MSALARVCVCLLVILPPSLSGCLLLVPENARLVEGMRTRAQAEEAAVNADLTDDLEPLSHAVLMTRAKTALARCYKLRQRGVSGDQINQALRATNRLTTAAHFAGRREWAAAEAAREAERQAREAELEAGLQISNTEESEEEESEADIPDESMSSSDDEAPATSHDKEVIRDLMSLLDENKHKTSEGMYLSLSNSLKRRHDQVGR